MNSRILFLGTGGDIFLIGKQHRASGGMVINYEKNQFHIDPGPGTLVMAKATGLNLRENTAIFMTGNDLFRANDINAVISAMTLDGLDKRGVLVSPSSVMTGDNARSAFLNKFYMDCLEKTINVGVTRKLAINNIEIEIIELKEDINTACGFKFITPRYALSYLPNTQYSSEVLKQLEDTDILVMNIADPRSTSRKEFLNSEDAQKIIEKIKPQLAILTGFSVKMLESDPLYEAREIQKATGIQVISAKDGMTINPLSFAATVRQKNLTSYSA